MITRYITYSLIVSLLIGCSEDAVTQLDSAFTRNRPSDFTQVVYPTGNEYSEARWELGKKLFYDNSLSIDSSISCASCHKAELAFSDNVALSAGVFQRPGVQNAPSLANVAYHPYYTRAGGVATLEMQVLVPLQEHNEFDFNIVAAAERIAQDSTYTAMSWQAYNRAPDSYVITRALANFERELISNNSRFDQQYFQNNEVMNAEEIAGMELFYSEKTNCFKCHSGPNFTNYEFENNGLYAEYDDLGRKRLTGEDSDNALFKVASLRNIAVTGPYMHDGSLASLNEVIEHYSRGGRKHPNQSIEVKSLHLSSQEENELVAFLGTLTDEEFLINIKLKKE